MKLPHRETIVAIVVTILLTIWLIGNRCYGSPRSYAAASLALLPRTTPVEIPDLDVTPSEPTGAAKVGGIRDVVSGIKAMATDARETLANVNVGTAKVATITDAVSAGMIAAGDHLKRSRITGHVAGSLTEQSPSGPATDHQCTDGVCPLPSGQQSPAATHAIFRRRGLLARIRERRACRR